ncbi:hypothetical protein ABG768_018956 [Culter alburnus]|uniref:BESS domain-containing protein n=1 Tax=Culter alburnus TaxID=194366 RepID=A0AAW2ATQ3_CULAL
MCIGINLTVDECRKKWRDLCDVYVRERREEKKRKSGAAATQKRPWRYYHIMSFLLPFVSSQPTSGNMEEEKGEGRRNEEDSAEVITEERQEMQVEKDMTEIRNSVEISAEDNRMDHVVEDMTGEEESGKRQSAKYFAQPRQRRRRIEADSVSSFERKIVEAIETSNCPAPAVSEDPDMQFLQSLMPTLKRIEPKCRELTKLKIHQLIFEAEFNCKF